MMTLSSKYSQLNVIAGGKSYEGRNLTGVHLSYKQGNPAIVIDGGKVETKFVESGEVSLSILLERSSFRYVLNDTIGDTYYV